jgi:hypothetical protein
MTRNEFRDLVYKTFIAGWGSETIYTFENEQFVPPEPATPGSPRAGTPWVRLSVRHSESRQKTLGPVGRRKFEHKVRLVLQIFTVPNTGLKRSDQLAQKFFEIFDEDLGRATVFGGETAYRERGTAEGWQMSEAWVDYTYDETR